MNKSKFLLRSLMFFSCLLMGNNLAFAAATVIDQVDVKTSGQSTEIEFSFGTPLQYRNHTPQKKGDLLQVEMRALGDLQQITDLDRRYSPSWDKSSKGPLTEISYEGDATGRILLLLRFRHEVDFKLVGSANPRNLKISVSYDVATLRQKDSHYRYAVNLRSSLQPINLKTVPTLELLKQYRLYTTEAEVDGRLWHRLRLGFFPDKESAIEVFEQLKKDFPHAWVTKAPRSDHAAAEVMTPAKNAPPPEQKPAETPSTPGPAVAPAPIPVPVPAPPSAPSAVTTPKPTVETSQEAQREQSLLDEGESVMVAQNYSRAVQIYTRLTQSEDPAIRQQAQEYLGLARERNGQLAHAKAEYEKYLQLYPKGEGVERVKQRLAGLLTARATPKGKLRKAKRPLAKNEWRNEVYGSFSQFYDRDVTYTDSSDTIINRTALSSDLDINTRSRNDHYDIRTTFIGGLENSFLDDGEDEVTINSLYVDALIRKLELSTRIGRQSRSSGGVLGRFDGGLLRWQFNDSVAVNLVGGFPVASTKDTDIDTDRPLYGISFDLGTFAKRWNFTTYFITQDVQGILDRRAIGGEVRYFDPTLSFFGLVDYDVSYSKLNTALLTANWTLPTKTSLNMSIDYRTSPILTTSSALIGQTTLTSIDAMRSTLTEDEIRQLARDRTATTRTFTLGFTQPLNQKLQISGDVTMSDYSGTPASPEVPSATPGDPPLIVALEAQPKTGFDYYYSLQLIGSSLIKDGDIAILGLRYSDTQTSNTYSVSVNTRYPVTREFRVNPRAILDYRTNKDGNSEQWKFRPLLRLEYTWKRRYHLELEGGGEWSSEKLAGNGQSDDRRGYFLTVGYRISF